MARKVRPWPFWDPRGRCPHCRAWITDRRHLVVASRHCPECGGRVLAAPPGPDDLVPESRYDAAVRVRWAYPPGRPWSS